MSQQDSSGACYDLIKLERSEGGKTRQTFLEPLSMQGTCTIDDGRHAIIYLPDKRRIVVQDSFPRQDDLDHRIAWSMDNYSFSYRGKSEIAGRDTDCILATPHDKRIESRRYYLDSETGYPLKLETLQADGQPVLKFEVKDVQFPTDLKDASFNVQTFGRLDKVVHRHPRPFVPIVANDFLGFTPRFPLLLPMGFHIQQVQLDASQNWRCLIVRLTDGLVRSTLYEWKCDRDTDTPVRLFEKNSQTQAHGVRLVLLGDLPLEARRQLLNAFVAGSRATSAISMR